MLLDLEDFFWSLMVHLDADQWPASHAFTIQETILLGDYCVASRILGDLWISNEEFAAHFAEWLLWCLLHFQIHVNFRTNEAGRPRGVDYEMFPAIEKRMSFDWKFKVSHPEGKVLTHVDPETTQKLHVLVNILQLLYLFHCQFTPITIKSNVLKSISSLWKFTHKGEKIL